MDRAVNPNFGRPVSDGTSIARASLDAAIAAELAHPGVLLFAPIVAVEGIVDFGCVGCTPAVAGLLGHDIDSLLIRRLSQLIEGADSASAAIETYSQVLNDSRELVCVAPFRVEQRHAPVLQHVVRCDVGVSVKLTSLPAIEREACAVGQLRLLQESTGAGRRQRVAVCAGGRGR